MTDFTAHRLLNDSVAYGGPAPQEPLLVARAGLRDSLWRRAGFGLAALALHGGVLALILTLGVTVQSPAAADTSDVVVELVAEQPAPPPEPPQAVAAPQPPEPEVEPARDMPPPPEPEPPQQMAMAEPEPPEPVQAVPPPDPVPPPPPPKRTEAPKPKPKPKPQPVRPSASAQAAAAPASAAQTGRTSVPPDYTAQIRARLLARLTYPEAARGGQDQGRPVVRFVIARSGAVSGIGLVSSSGSGVLDAAALALVRQAGPFPALPPDFSPSTLSLTIPVHYRRPG